MCLTAKTGYRITAPRPKIAKEDIVCYKMLTYYTDKFDEINFQTPFRASYMYLGKRHIDRKKIDIYPFDKTMKRNDIWQIEGGVMHVYKNLDDAISDVSLAKMTVIVYAIIPKGTKYYEGGYGTYMDTITYGAKELILTKNVAYVTNKGLLTPDVVKKLGIPTSDDNYYTFGNDLAAPEYSAEELIYDRDDAVKMDARFKFGTKFA